MLLAVVAKAVDIVDNFVLASLSLVRRETTVDVGCCKCRQARWVSFHLVIVMTEHHKLAAAAETAQSSAGSASTAVADLSVCMVIGLAELAASAACAEVPAVVVR